MTVTRRDIFNFCDSHLWTPLINCIPLNNETFNVNFGLNPNSPKKSTLVQHQHQELKIDCFNRINILKKRCPRINVAAAAAGFYTPQRHGKGKTGVANIVTSSYTHLWGWLTGLLMP
ncbi:hypothetical protein M0804_009809 [Polistes exclamans]|nr:hypothetical protein M0804_009809 [Polistes exclamans]